MKERWSFATGSNANYIDSLYADFKNDPTSVDASWRTFFDGYEFAMGTGKVGVAGGEETQEVVRVQAMINAFRRFGHLSADINPLAPTTTIAEHLRPENHGLQIKPDAKFRPANFGSGEMTFKEIQDKLVMTYCGHIGADFKEINSPEIVTWFQEQMEGCNNRPTFSVALKKRILAKLSAAEGFEQFLQARYLGQKRFSLEGLDTLVPLLDILNDEAASNGIEELCMGMAHRGRLNVLINILQKPITKMLMEFEGNIFNPFDIEGDVKYHMGFATTVQTFSGKSLRLFLAPNPSHLEAVNPLIEGFSRFRQERLGGVAKVMPVLLHGDASFIGQGLVAETLNLAYLQNYTTGGTIHIITNNQIGFTTNPEEGKSCTYSADMSKIIRAPVLHVNADDPEAVAWAGQLAVRFRAKFNKDIVVDLLGYRRHGHNETDEPGFTQPLMYKVIGARPTVLTQYKEKLRTEGEIKPEELDAPAKETRDYLQGAHDDLKAKKATLSPIVFPEQYQEVFTYKRASRSDLITPFETKVSAARLKTLGEKICAIPSTVTPHPKVKKLYQSRVEMLAPDAKIDWGFGELLAFASLADEGYEVRLSGQDCKRGTFSSRHGVVFDYKDGKPFEPLNQIGGARVSIINSPLSEQGCLGFEFGYSIASRKSLILWEAQFGDFANGAQIIVDQFMVACEAKWQLTSGLVLLLPHGYEGMGPEHSSARPERFLQCCGNLNIQVCNVTSPAQLFHLLRRQALRPFKKPLVIMSPKSLLRHPKVVSTQSEFTQSCFKELIDDDKVGHRDKVEKILLCTGKIYFELEAVRESRAGLENVAIIRFEQLYPFPYEMLSVILKRYSSVRELVWVQEEPKNMGAWSFVSARIRETTSSRIPLSYIGRKNSGSTAEGSKKGHQVEQERIVEEAFSLACAWEPKVVAQK